MKEKILQVLKEKVGKTSLSDKTISDYVAGIANLVTEESQLTEQFYAAHVNIIKSMDGNFSHDVAAQVEEAKKNLSNSLTPPATPPAFQSVEEKPQWAKDLDARFAAIEQANLVSQKQEQRTQLLESVKKTALTKDAANEKSGWATNAGVLETAIRLVQIDDTDTVETIEQKCQQEYNVMYKNHFGAANAVPGVGNGGGSGSDSRVDAIAKAWAESKGITIT